MLWVVLLLLVPATAVAWLVRCGGRWRTAGVVLAHLVVAVAVFSIIATAIAESKSTVCYNGPCTEHTAALFGVAAEIVLTAICIVAGLAAWLVGGRGAADEHPLRLRLWLVTCDVLALGALAAGAVAYGNHLGNSHSAAQPVLRSSQVTHAR